MVTNYTFTVSELLSLYSTVSDELFNLNCSDFEGCEQAMVKNHLLSAKLLSLIIDTRKTSDTQEFDSGDYD